MLLHIPCHVKVSCQVIFDTFFELFLSHELNRLRRDFFSATADQPRLKTGDRKDRKVASLAEHRTPNTEHCRDSSRPRYNTLS